MMTYSFANKNVSIGGKSVITDWRQARVVFPENLQEKIEANEAAKKEIKKQREIAPKHNNATTAEAV